MEIKDKEGFVIISSVVIFLVGGAIGWSIGIFGGNQIIGILIWWGPWFIWAMTIPIIADSVDGFRGIELNPDGWLKAFAESTNNWY